MVLMIGGLITIVCGLVTIFWCGNYLLEILKAQTPFVLIGVGLIAIFVGYLKYKYKN